MNEVMNNHYRKAVIYKRRYLKFDFISAIVVFLVAVPLCLGIALASNAPLFSGIISGIIGGIVVGIFSGSHVSVSGPAAAMAAIVLAAIAQLGDFNVFLLAVVFAGILQVLVGYMRAGFIADYIPSNVVQGLLCAIGILLIIKQLPLAFTLSSEMSELKLHLLETTEGLTMAPLVDLSRHLNMGAMLISFLSLTVLIYFDKTKITKLKEIPASIIVVVLGVVLNELFIMTQSSLAQNTPQLVNIPTSSSLNEFMGQLQYPSWSAWTNPRVYLYGFILATVASLASLLNLKAGEKLDRKKRACSKNRELMAQGLGNITAGLIGGIPVTSVIVRTSVNIQSGAKTKIAAILHGMFILASVTLIPGMLNKIPLCSLAAILIFTGYKLTNLQIYKHIYQQGSDRFIPFIITVVSIVFFNLLAGILIGLAISLFYILKSHSQTRFDIIKENYPNGVTNRLVLPQHVTFLNKASLVAELNSLPMGAQLTIDARYTTYIDKEILELLKDFKNDRAPHKQIAVNLTGFKDHYDVHDYIDFINITTYDVQLNLTAANVLDILYEGNQRFLNDTRIHRNPKVDIQHTAQKQHPVAVVLGCIDSRVPVEMIFDMSFGDVFCIRIAGNVVNNDILASMEFACQVAGAKLIVVLGHTRCGAIQAACDNVQKGHLSQLLKKIKPAVDAAQKMQATSDQADIKHAVTDLNIANTLKQIYNDSDILHQMITNDDISMVGACYDVSSGKVHFQNYAQQLMHFENKDTPFLTHQLTKLLETSKIGCTSKDSTEKACSSSIKTNALLKGV